MGDVYRLAKRVLVWLGSSKTDHNAPYLFRSLCQLSALAAQEPTRLETRAGSAELIEDQVVLKCQEILKCCKFNGYNSRRPQYLS
jgi:hypothetical protein